MMIDPILFQIFGFKKPIELEEVEYGYGVIADHYRTIIHVERDIPIQLMPLILARAKLAEINPLIVTLPISEDSPHDELALCQLFEYLCEPLREAWTWKILRTYARIFTRSIFSGSQLRWKSRKKASLSIG